MFSQQASLPPDSAFAPQLPDIARTRKAVEQIVAEQPMDLGAAALDYFDNLTGPNWSLEWNLPRWLGKPHGLPETRQADLVLANGLGLMALRLLDDLADGDLPPGPAYRDIGESCLAGCVSILGWLVPGDDPFWVDFRAGLATWLEQQDAGGFQAARGNGVPDSQLAAAGAPLLLTAHLVTVLAESPDLLPPMRACLTAYLSAAVRLDQLKDWQADLAHGRRNLFVDSLLGNGPGRPSRDRRALVWQAIVHDDGYQAYLRTIMDQTDAARRLATALGCPELAAYLKIYKRQADATGRALRSEMINTFSRLQTRLLGPSGQRIR